MTIYKIQKHKNKFSQISNNIINNPNLSAKAKGILIYLISKPPKWEVHFKDIIKHMTDGETAIRSGLKELELSGYILRDLKRNSEDGKFEKWIWNVYEDPLPINERSDPKSRKFERKESQKPRGITILPGGGNRDVDKRDLENQQGINTDSINTEYSNKDKRLKDGDKSPSETYKEHLKKTFPSLALGIPVVEKLKGVLDNLYDYPANLQETIKAFSRRWKIPPPPKGSSDYGKWCKDATDVYKKCKNAQLSPNEVFVEAYYVWKTPPKFLNVPRDLYEGNFTVYDIGSVSKLVWTAISNILSENRQRRVKVYTDANGKKMEVEQ